MTDKLINMSGFFRNALYRIAPFPVMIRIFLSSYSRKDLYFTEEADLPASFRKELENRTGIVQNGNPLVFERREIRAAILGDRNKNLTSEETVELKKNLEMYLQFRGRNPDEWMILPYYDHNIMNDAPGNGQKHHLLIFWKRELPLSERILTGLNITPDWKSRIVQSLGVSSTEKRLHITYEMLGRKEGICYRKFFVMRRSERTVISAITNVFEIKEKLKTRFFERIRNAPSPVHMHHSLKDKLSQAVFLGTFSAEILHTGEFRMWSSNIVPLIYRKKSGRVVPLFLRKSTSGRIREGTLCSGDVLILSAGRIFPGEIRKLQERLRLCSTDPQKIREELSGWADRTYRGRILAVFL